MSIVLTLLLVGSDSAGSEELTGAAAAELVVEVVSALLRLAVVVVVSVGFVSLEEVDVGEISAEPMVAE